MKLSLYELLTLRHALLTQINEIKKREIDTYEYDEMLQRIQHEIATTKIEY